MASSAEVGMLPVRQTLIDKYGISNDRIGYNPDNGYVTVDNQNLFKPPSNQNGSTYAGQDLFNSAQGQITTQNNAYAAQQNQLKTQESANQLQQQAMTPKVNPYDAQVNQLNTSYLDRIKTPVVNPMDARFNQLLETISGRLANPAAIDPYTSPQYAAAQAQVQQGAQRATRQSQEVLGDSGFSQSTRLSDRAQGIQNDANQQ